MLWEYIGKVFAFGLRRTTPTIDSLQILAASAVPGVAKLVGVKMAANVTNDVLAYIGAMAIAFVMLRLVSAPYFIWREQVGEIGTLKLELSRPERLEIERMSKHRAKVRAQMAGMLREMHWEVFGSDPVSDKTEAIATHYRHLVNLGGRGGLSPVFGDALDIFERACTKAAQDDDDDAHSRAFVIIEDIISYLHGRTTGEALALQLPSYTEAKTQP